MLNKKQLTKDVEYFLKSKYHLNPHKVKPVLDVVLANWFKELETEGSHLSADLVADDVAEIAKRYLLVSVS